MTRSTLVVIAFAVAFVTGCEKGSTRAGNDLLRDVALGDVKSVEKALKTDPVLRNTRDRWDKSTLLHRACVNVQRLEMVKVLLAAGVDVNATNDLGQTPLHLAYRFSAESNVIQVLLEAGANSQVRDTYGKRPADY